MCVEVKTELLSQPLAVDEDEAEPDTELQAALARARRLRQAETAQEAHYKLPKVTDTTMVYYTTSYLIFLCLHITLSKLFMYYSSLM